MVKHCPHCGSEASESAVFCRICGKKISTDDSEVVRSLEKEIDELIADSLPKKEIEMNSSQSKKEVKVPPQARHLTAREVQLDEKWSFVGKKRGPL